MISYTKFLLSAAAATLALSSLALAEPLPNGAGDAQAQHATQAQQPANDAIETAALATPLPSANKILGPKQANDEADTLAPKAEKKSPGGNPYNYGPTDELEITIDPRDDGKGIHKLALSKAIEKALGEEIKGAGKLEKKDLSAIAAFYTDHSFETLWVKDGEPTPQTKAVMDRLAKAHEDGLDSQDYLVETAFDKEDADAVATFEIALSKALLHYARDAQAGRIAPSKVSSTIKLRPVYPDPSTVMLKLATSTDKAAALASYNPTHQQFKDLKQELARLHSLNDDKETVIVPSGEAMHIEYHGPRVKILRERLNVPALADEDPEIFDETLQTAVKAFQTENNLIADGIAGPKTLRIMNGTEVNRIPDIIANMEAWRWMSRDLGELHVIANVPSYNITIMKNGENIHRTRVVVGKTRHKTPIFSDQMEFVVVNPYWNVPYSIASKELLPNIRANPGYVSSRNYEILHRGRVVNPASVNWSKASFRQLRIRQRPGGRNALGRVKFLFPNDYAVYFHDTPSKSLFQRASRAFSHGCVRVHNPFEFGDVLMKQSKGWQNGSLKKMIGSKERWIKLKDEEQIPVHITYFTAVSDGDGQISYKSDVYGHNMRLKRALGLI